MTDRDRLIDLLYDVQDARIDTIADHLLANGVIVPPCKVGDKVWHKEEGYLLDSYTVKFVYQDMLASNISQDFLFSRKDIGKTVFLTKEEAEEKLKEMSNNVNL